MTTLIETGEPFALSPRDAAKRLGVDVSTLYRNYGNAMRSGKVRTLKIWRSPLDYIEVETRRGDSDARTQDT